MIKNYFKIAWRNITKHRFYSIVNIVGLFMGITFALLIGGFVWQELQVNQQLRNSNRQYFLTSIWKDPNLGNPITTLGPLSKRLKEDYPNLVANYYRWDGITSIVSKGDKHLRQGIQLGDSTLLKMFGFTLLHGDINTALNNPFSVVITKAMAVKYFGKTDVVGEMLDIHSFSGEVKPFAVTGVLNEISENSVTVLNANNNNEVFIPTNTFSYFGRDDFESWNNAGLPGYIELKEGVIPAALKQPIAQLIQKNTTGIIKENLTVKPVLMKDYYRQDNNALVMRMIYTLSLAGLFILLMAVINFINIAISRSGARMREIGVRKVLGSLRRQLIFQFLTESFILTLVATALAVVAYPLMKPVFSEMVGKNIPGLQTFPTYFLSIPFALILMLAFLAGLYPAFILSSLKSVDSLKGKLKTAKENILLRKSLVGFQFTVAMIVLVAAFVVTQQVSFFFGKNIGYNKEYVVSSQVPRNWSPEGIRKMLTVRNEFVRDIPEIASATVSYEIPNGMNGGSPPMYKNGADSTAAVAMMGLATDENYLSTYKISLKAGSFFETLSLDSGKVIINEKAVQTLGFENASSAIGQQLKIPGDQTVFTVKGVCGDFSFLSMQSAVQPMVFFNVQFTVLHRYLSFKLKPGNVAASIAAIEKKWAQLLPGSSFEYTFMDDTLKKMYATELQLKKAAYTSTVLALIIVLLGVLGLVSLSIHKRVKEIGIRKVLGASLLNIILLFVKEFIIVIAVAALVACPLAYYMMKEWLNNYAYRINITAVPFIWTISALGVITLLLIGLQAFKAAQANPTKNLKTE
jgi:putative ABC transport system permease protein